MEKLSAHNLNKPPFCSLSILNTLPASSMLQLAATHLFVAAGYVSETLIEQQKSSLFKQTALVNRPECCKLCQDCGRVALHRLMAGNGIFQCIQWILLEHLHLPWEVLLVLPCSLGSQLCDQWASRHMSLHFRRLRCCSDGCTTDVQEGKNLPHDGGTHVTFLEGPALSTGNSSCDEASKWGMWCSLVWLPPGSIHSPTGQGSRSEDRQPRKEAVCLPDIPSDLLQPCGDPPAVTSKKLREHQASWLARSDRWCPGVLSAHRWCMLL